MKRKKTESDSEQQEENIKSLSRQEQNDQKKGKKKGRKKKGLNIIDRRQEKADDLNQADKKVKLSKEDADNVQLDQSFIPEEYSHIFEKFKFKDKDQLEEQFPVFDADQYQADSDDVSTDEEDQQVTTSLRKLLKQSRMSVAELKSKSQKPEVVEWFDVTAADPLLLVYLKSYRNTVPVPAHWSLKRKYLSAKRGFLKPPFELPHYIKDTGIMQMRESVQQQEASRTLRAKMRDKVRPRIGKIVMDYQRLHDAFFKYQTKPPNLSCQGDIYYEGKEFESKLKEKKPGVLSDELKEALGMTHPLLPTPWLINMQRFGPPPSYPKLRIPGLNAPIPKGAQWGYMPGGYGKPPLDEHGNPLYGDVFGTAEKAK